MASLSAGTARDERAGRASAPPEAAPRGLDDLVLGLAKLILCRGNLPVPPSPLHRSAIADERLRRWFDMESNKDLR